MKTKLFLLVAVMLALVASGLRAENKPNVIIIYADDLGYGDLSCYGSETIATPCIDRMASEGLRFVDFYSASPFCSPSRAALLTGRLPARCGVPYVLFPAEHTGLPPDELTIAEVLKQQNYATMCIGKWHLGWDRVFRPTEQGFDEFYGLPCSNDSNEWPVGEGFMQVMNLEPLPLVEGNKVVEAPVDQSLLTQHYTERAQRFIRAHKAAPFFLYFAHSMPHIPQYASKKFEGKSKGGLYGDAVEELDWSVGRLLDTLKQEGLDKNTLVIFASDNGAVIKRNAPKGKAAYKSRFPGRDNGGSNGKLRAGKGTTWEGGVRVPCIVRWPEHIEAGRVETRACSMMDIFPTVARLGHARLPEKLILDGMDISQGLLDKTKEMKTRVIYDYFGVQIQAVREGPWKLILPVSDYPKERVPSLWFIHRPELFERQHRLWPKATLYDLQSDIGETKDLAGDHPEVVARLQALAVEYDTAMQNNRHKVMYVDGPQPPKPGEVRTGKEDLAPWKTENR